MPKPRGPLSEWVVARLGTPVDGGRHAPPADGWDDECITLWTLHELSYRGFEDAAHDAEWQPSVLEVRHDLEVALEQRLRRRWSGAVADDSDVSDVPAAIDHLVSTHDGPSLADHVRRRATTDEVLELFRQRSVYQLKEADPMTWVIPHLPTRSKAALVELQYDEYGDGDPNRMHSHLFARGMAAVGLRPEYGAYVDDALPETLELNNALTMLGLHRTLRGAAVGHLAAFEMTSTLPSRKMVQGLARLGLDGPMSAYYDEHVEADAIHEILATHTICGTLAEDEPDQAAEILFGAFTCLDLEARLADALLTSWEAA